MKGHLLDAAVTKIVGGGFLGMAVFGGLFTPSSHIPFFNTSITTLGMALAGSLIAFAYGTPVDSRKKLYGYAIGGVFIGVWVAQILPAWGIWAGTTAAPGWYNPETMEPPLAGMISLLSRWAVPFVIEQLPSLWSRIFGSQKSGQSPGERK